MSAESPAPANSPIDAIKSESIDLDSVFTPPTRDEWLTSALAGLPNHDSLDTLNKQTLDGLTIQVLYDASSSGQLNLHLHSASSAGAWDNRLCISHDLEDAVTNKKILTGLNGGNSSLQLQVNDSTHLDTVLNGVRLELSAVSLRSGMSYASAANNFLVIANSQAVDKQTLKCAFNADPIGSWLKGESETLPDQSSLETMATFCRTMSQQIPMAQTVLVDAALHHNAGASAQQELVATMATAAVYLEALLIEGLTLEQASQHIVFQVACDADVLMGIVKLRSLKGLWQHLLSEFAAARKIAFNPDSTSIHIVAETSKRYLSKQDYWSNHLRNIAASTAAAMGSATTIIVHPHDKVHDWQATEDSSLGERIARNLPIILDRECGLIQVADPTAGSFAIETLTQQLMQLTWQSLSEIDTGDTWIETLASGQWQQALTETHTRRVQRLRDEANIMVGVNRFTEQPANAGNINESQGSANAHPAVLRMVRDAEEFDTAAFSATRSGATS